MENKGLTFKDIRVPDGQKFEDVSAEVYRTYKFADCEVTINHPVALYVSDHGSHFVIDLSGTVTYVRSTFVAIEWKTQPGTPHIKFTRPGK